MIMDKSESLADFYKNKLNWMPEQIRNEIGHFNVFRLEPFTGENAKPVPYKRRDYYKIMLVVGNSKVHFADRVVEVQKQALSFSNPQIPTSGSIWTISVVGHFAFSITNFSISLAI